MKKKKKSRRRRVTFYGGELLSTVEQVVDTVNHGFDNPLFIFEKPTISFSPDALKYWVYILHYLSIQV